MNQTSELHQLAGDRDDSVVSDVMQMPDIPEFHLNPHPAYLTKELIRSGWRPYATAICRNCNSFPVSNSRTPNTLACLNPSCGNMGTNPEENTLLFIEVREVAN